MNSMKNKQDYPEILKCQRRDEDGSFTRIMKFNPAVASRLSDAVRELSRGDHGGDTKKAGIMAAANFLADVLYIDDRDPQDQTVTLSINRR